MLVVTPDEVRVNLVADNKHIMRKADIAKLAQLFPAPDAPDRIMRRAEDVKLDLVLDNFLF